MDHEHKADTDDLLNELRKQHEENSIANHWAQVDALPRRIVQIAATAGEGPDAVYALCSDGKVAYMNLRDRTWVFLPPISQEQD